MQTTPAYGDHAHTASKLREDLTHIFKKMDEISKKFDECGNDAFPPKLVLQFGYNAGRLSELIGAGRNVWDSFKVFLEPGMWWTYGPAGNHTDTLERWMQLAAIEIGEDEIFFFRIIKEY